jgi:glycosyltransferase involved in cell wall biosynthesis
MRIGVNCFPLEANSGGVKQYFFSLFRELLSSDDGLRYVFFYFPQNVEELSNLDCLDLEENGVSLTHQNEIEPHFNNIDLYFCPFSSLWPRPVPLPTVLFLHDIQEVFYPHYFTETDMFNREWHYPGSTRMATQVVTNSHFTRQTIVHNHRISSPKITVAHLCADERFYRAGDVARLPQSPLPGDDFIFYPANYWQHKNHDGLLKALRWLKLERGLIINAVFTGYDVPNSFPLDQKVSEYGLDEQIFNAGYRSVEELAYLYLKARLMVFPSLFEGFGIPLVEAMAAGCPVAASNATSVPEIGGDAVEYFDPCAPESIARAIERIWCDDAMRSDLIQRGRTRARNFSSAKLAQTHLNVFRKAAGSFSKARYAWHKCIYQHYHRSIIFVKYRNHISRKLRFLLRS